MKLNNLLFVILISVNFLQAEGPELSSPINVLTAFNYMHQFLTIAQELEKENAGKDVSESQKLACASCGHEVSGSYMLGELLGTLIKSVEDKEKFAKLEVYIKEQMKLLKERDEDGLKALMLRAANETKYVCTSCKKTEWKVAEDKKEKKTAGVTNSTSYDLKSFD